MFLKIQWLKISNEFPSPCFVISNKDKSVKKIIDPKTQRPLNSLSCRVTKAKIETFSYIDKITKKESTGIAYKVFIEYNNKSHILDIGTSRVGRQILNSLLGATKEQLEDVLISVYRNKAGFNAVYVAHDWAALPWSIKPEELKTLITQTKNAKGEVVDTDASAFDAKVTPLLEEKEYPARTAKQEEVNALDFLDDDEEQSTIVPEDIDDLFDQEPTNKSKSAKVGDEELHIDDIPF
jgi:hypothetical protein